MRYFKIIISLIIVVVIAYFTSRFLHVNQKETSFSLVELNDINNKNGFLWQDAYIDTSWFVIQDFEVKSVTHNESVDISVLEYKNDNSLVKPKNINLFIEDIPNSQIDNNKFTLYYSDIESLETGNLKIGIIAKGKKDGSYRYYFKIKYNGFGIIDGVQSVMKFNYKIDVNNQSSTLAVFFIILFIIIVVSLLCWFLLLKNEYFPTFVLKGQLNISEPEVSTIFLNKNARKLIIGDKLKEKENFFTKLFIGEIQYEFQGSNHSALISPYKEWKTKKVLYRLSCKGDTNSEIVNAESYLKHLDKYKLRTNEEVISFEYFNIKHY